MERSTKRRTEFMKREIVLPFLLTSFAVWFSLCAQEAESGKEASAPSQPQERELRYPCPMSLITKTRTAKTVGKGHFSVSLKTQYIDYDESMGKDGRYHALSVGDKNRKLITLLTTKYGWAKHHHVAVGIPYLWNDFDVAGKVTENDGFGNVFLFEKWNCIREGKYIPAVSVDGRCLFPTGNTDRKLGSSDDAGMVTAEISKTWKHFSLHLNPGYTFKEGADVREVNAAVLLTPTKKFWPMVEYNFSSIGGGGDSHDIVPGVMWTFYPGARLRVGAVINCDSSTKYREEVGVAARISYRF